jgi:TldD protein
MLDGPTPQQLHQVLDILLSRGGDFAEVYLESTRSHRLTWDDGRLDEAAAGSDRGVGMRIEVGELTYFANGNDTDFDSLLELARDLAEALPGTRQVRPPTPVRRDAPTLGEARRWPREVTIAERVAHLERMETTGRSYDPRVVQVTGILLDAENRVTLANSEGLLDHEWTPYITLYAQVVAREGEVVRTGLESASATRGYEFLEETTPEEVVREAARRAVLQVGASPAPSGTFTVVLSSKAGGTMVHEACGHGLEADFFDKELSVYAGRLGEQVAAGCITVVDDGTLPGKRGTTRIDGEGQPSTRVVLIEKGILRNLLQSRRTARRLGMAPTGNGRRASYRHLPVPRMRNTIIAPGRDDPEQIIASVPDGLFVADMGGGEVDIVSGNFVFNCSEAYRIRDGKVAEPVRDATLTGNGPEVLRIIDRVGRDLGWMVGTCGKDGQGAPVASAQPTLRIPSIVVGGTALEGADR